MAKTFYTEHEIEDMVQRGTTSIRVNDDVVLTELAYEKAERLGVTLIREGTVTQVAADKPTQIPPIPQASNKPEADSTAALKKRVREAVHNRLGAQVDPLIVDKIIDRVLISMEWKH